MVSAPDITTYVGIPLALLGVTLILYTYLSTAYTSHRLRRNLKTYDIEASVYSRLLSGIVEANLPSYHLSIYPRTHASYWHHTNSTGAKHGASWDSLNWVRNPIHQKKLEIHYHDRFQLSEARVECGALVTYLSDLGLNVNFNGFWASKQIGLHVLPGTVLVEVMVRNGMHPILVVAKATIEHPGTLLLRVNSILTPRERTSEDLEPFWVPLQTSSSLPVTETSKETGVLKEKAEGNNGEGDERQESTVADTHFRISHKGIVERRLSNGKLFPIHGLSYWFVYSFLGTCAKSHDAGPNFG